MKVEAVFFDLFETLITEFANGIRISNRNYNYSELLGMTNDEFKIEWNNRQAMRMNGQYGSHREVIQDIVFSRKLDVRKEAIDYLVQERINEKKIPFDRIYDGILDMLRSIKNRNIKIGLISNCSEEEVRAWSDSVLADFFDDRIFSYEVNCSKPDRRIYDLACERLKVRSAASIFVGDGGSNELAGASQAGLKVYHAKWFNAYIKSEYTELNDPGELLKELDE